MSDLNFMDSFLNQIINNNYQQSIHNINYEEIPLYNHQLGYYDKYYENLPYF